MGSNGTWMKELKDKFLKYRGGCIIILNWGRYSDNINYFEVVEKFWYPVADVLEMKIKLMIQEGFLLENFLLYGHSLGAWMVIEVGTRFGKGKVGNIDGEFDVLY
jgi:Lipase